MFNQDPLRFSGRPGGVNHIGEQIEIGGIDGIGLWLACQRLCGLAKIEPFGIDPANFLEPTVPIYDNTRLTVLDNVAQPLGRRLGVEW